MPSLLPRRSIRFFACCWLLAACACGPQSNSNQTPAMSSSGPKTFELTAGPCSADDYWVTIQGGSFLGPGGAPVPVPSGHTLEGGWGASGTVWSSGDDQHPAPDQLSLLWFSYGEDKFYKGDFALPQAKILSLLNQGTWDLEKQKHVSYNEFTVCVIPKGGVVVWLTGGNQVFLGRFQGSEFTPSAADYARYYGAVDRAGMVAETRGEMPPEVQAQIKAGNISAQKWDAYLKTYPWQVAFNVPFTLSRYSWHGVNAERFSDPITHDDLAAYRQFVLSPVLKAAPKRLFLYGQAEHGGNYLLQVESFDEAETKAAFQALHAANPVSPITLLFTIDRPFQKATLTLKNEAKEIPLAKSKVEVFSTD